MADPINPPKKVKRFKLKEPVWIELTRLPKEEDPEFQARGEQYLSDFDARFLHYNAKKAEHLVKTQERDAKQVVYEQAGEVFKDVVEGMKSQIDTDYEPLINAWKVLFEVERTKVDRIGYIGKLPCNVLGATVGDYIVPIVGPDDTIMGSPVAAPTLEQYLLSVGQVKSIGVKTIIRVKSA